MTVPVKKKASEILRHELKVTARKIKMVANVLHIDSSEMTLDSFSEMLERLQWHPTLIDELVTDEYSI